MYVLDCLLVVMIAEFDLKLGYCWLIECGACLCGDLRFWICSGGLILLV